MKIPLLPATGASAFARLPMSRKNSFRNAATSRASSALNSAFSLSRSSASTWPTAAMQAFQIVRSSARLIRAAI